MKQRFAIAALAAVLFAAPVLAQCQKTCQKAKPATSEQEPKACSHHDQAAATAEPGASTGEHAKSAMCPSDVTCDGDVVRYEGIDLPRVGFKVGETVTCCMKSAIEMSGGDNSKIKFVVADKTYDVLEEAQAARLKVLEQYYEDILTLKYAVGDESVADPAAAQELADKSGQPLRYRLAKFDFSDKSAAEKAIEAARAAGEKVAMGCVAGEKVAVGCVAGEKVAVGCVASEKEHQCPMQAAQAAKDTGKPVGCCVGEKKTECPATARMRLVEARITTALKTIAEAAAG